MYIAIAIIQLILFVFLMTKFMKKQGLIVFVDPPKIMFILWILALILYDFKLSTYYNPTLLINVVVILIWGSFLILSKFIRINKEDIYKLFIDFEGKKLYKRYFKVSNVIFGAALVFFIYSVYKYGFAIAQSNKIGKQGMDHYSAYIVYMLVLAAEIKYILFRNYKKPADLVILILSTVILLLTLNRGPLVFLVTTIALYEVFNFINIKEHLDIKTQYKIYGSFVLVLILTIVFFGYIGNLRMDYVLNYVYHKSLQDFYGMSSLIPSGFLWVYIYLTSPLENMAYSLSNQQVQYTYFNSLFYPFIKLFANIFGKGEAYKQWFVLRGTYTPYLYDKIGLNAPSFIGDAFGDLGFVGFAVYLGIYIAIAYFAAKLIKKSVKLSSICKIIIYTNIVSILLWSVFVNSFKIPILILNIIVLLLIEYEWIFDIVNKLKRHR